MNANEVVWKFIEEERSERLFFEYHLKSGLSFVATSKQVEVRTRQLKENLKKGLVRKMRAVYRKKVRLLGKKSQLEKGVRFGSF